MRSTRSLLASLLALLLIAACGGAPRPVEHAPHAHDDEDDEDRAVDEEEEDDDARRV